VAIVETLRQLTQPGDAVVITSPVYPPFREFIREVGGVVVDVPLLVAPDRPSGYALDLDGLEGAFARGATAMLLCHPHNPLGLLHPAHELAAVAESAARHRVTVISDEIHSPLVFPGETFTPFLTVSDSAREWGITVASASKGFNLAGFKCAVLVAESERGVAVLDAMSFEVGARTSILGLHASVAAFRDDHEWLAGVITAIQESSALLTEPRVCPGSATVHHAPVTSPGSTCAGSNGATIRPRRFSRRQRSLSTRGSLSGPAALASPGSPWRAHPKC
jgi:cystathionine beta-lyase